MRNCLLTELHYRTSRASGPGGQHVNKTESRVELIWHPASSSCLNPGEKARMLKFFGHRLTEKGELILTSTRYRSQHRNKEDVEERFLGLVSTALIPPKKRVATRPTRASKERRIKEKKIRSDIKKSRRGRPQE